MYSNMYFLRSFTKHQEPQETDDREHGGLNHFWPFLIQLDLLCNKNFNDINPVMQTNFTRFFFVFQDNLGGQNTSVAVNVDRTIKQQN